MLKVLREHQWYAKLSKCSFFHTKVHYLGHISKEGIVVDPKNIRSIMEWPTPRNMDEVRVFMGLTSYYMRFIRNFSWIFHPIKYLQ